MLVMPHHYKWLQQASQICPGKRIEVLGDPAVGQNYSETSFSSHPILFWLLNFKLKTFSELHSLPLCSILCSL